VSIIKQNPTITLDENSGNVLISYIFNAPTTEFATSGSYPTILYANQTVIFQSIDYINNITQWNSINDTITGDVAFFQLYKDFRYSTDSYTYSPWFPLNLSNFNTVIGANERVLIQFRYSAIALQQNYNINVPFKSPDIPDWFPIIPVNSNTPYTFNKDYPMDGTLGWTIGHGTNGQYHIDTSTSKFYVKNNGVWEGGVYVVKNSTSGYIPTKFNGQILTDAFTNAITSRYPVIPINDYTLSDDLVFGTNFNTAQSSDIYRPQTGDNMFFNPLIQGVNLNGYQEIWNSYQYPVFPPNYTPKVYVKELDIQANQWINVVSTEPLFCLVNVGDQVIFKPPFLLKMYSINSFAVEVDGVCSTSWNACLDIKFRYSFNSRSWDSSWMPLTQANLSCIKGSPLKFFYIEFLFTKTCANNGNPICVSDLIIDGNIQNVSNDYLRLNRFGLRSDCDYTSNSSGSYNPATGACIDEGCSPNTIIPLKWVTDLQGCGNIQGTFNPYDITQLTALNAKTASDVSNIFGWEVDYYRVEANDAGIDVVFHEYGTYDTVDKQSVKVLIPDNKFPEEGMISFGMGGMALFDTFEINITIEEFANKFGVGTRPSNEDFLFFCQINKWYKVAHAQRFRDFLNAAVYYKITLDKKEDDTYVDNRAYTGDFNDTITNNQLDNLFGEQVQDEIKQVINVDDLQNLTEISAPETKFEYPPNVEILTNAGVDINTILDYTPTQSIELSVMVQSIEANLENGTTVISQNYYDLSTKINDIAIIYQRLDNDICDCCNRSFTVWFSITKYQQGMVYNLIDNFNSLVNQGYKVDFVDGNLLINFFGQLYEIDVSIGIGKWYGLVINFNQKQAKMEVYLYKRKGLCDTNELELLEEVKYPLTPVSYQGDLVMKLRGSYMFITNIRVWKEIIPKNLQSNILSQYVVRDSQNLILSDQATPSVISNSYKF
jgi:hypothetical protein